MRTETEQYHAQCGSKVRYPTRGIAVRKKKSMARRMHEKASRWGVYACPWAEFGQHWHIGHLPSDPARRAQ